MELWVNYTLKAFIFLICYILLFKYYSSQSHHKTDVIILNILFYIGFFLIMYYIVKKKHPIHLPIDYRNKVLLFALLFFIYNIVRDHMITIAPNPGYAQLLIYCDSIPILFISYLLFKSELNKKKIMGVIIVFIGLYGLTKNINYKKI